MTQVGLQLYTLRDECAQDLEGVLRAVSEIGYDGVELFDLHGHDAGRVRAWLDELGLVAAGRHAGLNALDTQLPALAEELRTLGCKRIALSWIDPPESSDDARAIVARIGGIAREVARHGLSFGFHNHWSELAELDDSDTLLDKLRALPAELLWLELDLGWVWEAGADPVAELERTAGRCPLVHVKDFRTRGSRVDCPVGEGDVGYDRVLPVAVRAGAEWLVVEQDNPEAPALAAVERSFAAVQRMLAGGRMSARVGIVGCGIIAKVYVEGSAAFDSFDVVACSDLDAESADAFAEMHGLRAASVDELIADPSIDVVLNLTPPGAHAAVIRASLEAGKHVYTEKPITTTLAEGRDILAEADRRGLRIGCAPDTFLGRAYETARELIARGEIGTPLAATATFLVGGPDDWHPNADVFYQAGGGPMLDIAPYYLTAIASLLGPYRAALGLASTPTPERRFGVGPRAGESFAVDVPTHAVAALQIESGALATVTVSFEAFGQYASGLVVHGSGGSLELPDANFFGGTVRIRNGDGEWKVVPYETPGPTETRGIGLDEMLAAIREDRPHRASGALALHVLETALAALQSADEGRTVEIGALEAVEPR